MRNFAHASCALLLTAGLALAQDQDFSKVEIKVTKVSGNVYMLEGAGGNIGASVGEDGIVVVDDEYAPLAEKIQAALKGVTDKPVRFIINTHFHGDHTGGNVFFQKQAPGDCPRQCAQATGRGRPGRQPRLRLDGAQARRQEKRFPSSPSITT